MNRTGRNLLLGCLLLASPLLAHAGDNSLLVPATARCALNTAPEYLSQAIAACQQLAQQGDALAQYELGEFFYQGQSAPRDLPQALHWFATPAFFAEVRRLLRPDGLFCAWCYSLLRLDTELDSVLDDFYWNTLDGYWPAGRASVDAGYQDIQPPFARIAVPAFAIQLEWDLQQLLGYLGTWSAVQRLEQACGGDPLQAVRDTLALLQTAPVPGLPPLRRTSGIDSSASSRCRAAVTVEGGAPLRRAAASVKSSFSDGVKAGFGATGGTTLDSVSSTSPTRSAETAARGIIVATIVAIMTLMRIWMR